MFKQLFIVILVLFTCIKEVNGQVRGTAKVDGIFSKILSEQRDLLIHLPNSYFQNKQLNYPVLYLTDGLRNFNHASGTLDLLTQSHEAQETIIVAIENTHRTRDFTPSYDESYNKWGISGGADNFLDFIQQELMPYINKHYRTNNFNILSGHSLGGLLSIYSLQTRPELFQAHFAFSPSLWWHDGMMIKSAKSFYAKTSKLSNYLYLNLADEKGHMLSSFNEYKQILKQSSPKGFSYDSALIEEENHNTSAMVGHNTALRHLYKKFQCPEEVIAQGLPAIKRYYTQLSKTYSAELKPSYYTLAQVAGIAFNNKQFAEAVTIYESLIKRFPHLSDPFYRLAYIYETTGEYHNAIQALDKAIAKSIDENVENNKYKSLRAYVLTQMNKENS